MAKSKCTLTVSFDGEKKAKDAAGILEKETAFKKRGSARVSIKNSALTIEIEADDIVAMRAMLNTYLRMLQTVEAARNALSA